MNVKEIIKPAFVLLIITAIAAALLGTVQSVTAPAIAEQTRKSQAEAMQAVFAEAEDFVAVEGISEDPEIGKIVAVYEAVVGGEVAGVVVNVQPDGFSGSIDTMVGIDNDGVVTGIKVLSHAETPGLGAKATEAFFQDQFVGQTGTVAVTKDGGEIQSITSATITSRAISSGVTEATAWFEKNGGAK